MIPKISASPLSPAGRSERTSPQGRSAHTTALALLADAAVGAAESSRGLAGRVQASKENVSASVPLELWKHHIAPFLGEDVLSFQSMGLSGRDGLPRYARQSLEEKWRSLISSERLAPWLQAEQAQNPQASKLELMERIIAAIEGCCTEDQLPVHGKSLEEKAQWIADFQFVMVMGPIFEQVSGREIDFGRPDRCREEAVQLRELLAQHHAGLAGLQELAISANISVLPPEIGLFTGLRTLVLGNNKLGWLPSEFGRLQSLEVLDLQGNRFAQIPSSVLGLRRLHNLDLARNQLLVVEEEIGELTHLRWLDVSENRLTRLPAGLQGCRELHLLDCRRNRLQSLPDELCEMAINQLIASENQLHFLPERMGRMNRLNTLRLSGNPLQVLPDSLVECSHLEHLDLSNTQIRDFPNGCDRLISLRNLEVRGADLTRLPQGIEQMPALQVLDLSDNRLTTFPIELKDRAQLQHLRLGNNQIRSFYFEPGDFPGLRNVALKGNILTSAEGAEHLLSLELMEYQTESHTSVLMQGPSRRRAAPDARRPGRRAAARRL